MKTNKRILAIIILALVFSLMATAIITTPKMLTGKNVISLIKQALGEGPEISISGVPDNKIVKGPITITITATSEHGVASITVNDIELETTTSGVSQYDILRNGNYVVKATDTQGVTSQVTVEITQIDDKEPSTTAPQATATQNSITVTFKQEDNQGSANSGLTAERKYRLTNAAGNTGSWVTTEEDTHTFNNLQDGTIYYVQTMAEDNVGYASLSEVTTIMTEFPSLENIVEITRTPEDTQSWTKKVVYTINVIGGDRYKFKTSTDGTTFVETNRQEINKNNVTLYGKIVCNGVESEIIELDTVTNVDVEPPTDTAPTTTLGANYITVTCNQTDSKSGINESTIRYRLLKNEQGTEVERDWQESNTFENLISEKNYYVQTKVEDNLGTGQESVIVIATTQAVTHGSNATVTYNHDWTNQDLNVTVSNPSSEFSLETSTDGVTWDPTMPITMTFTKRGKVYTRFTDGTNYGEVGVTDIDNIDKVAPDDAEPTVIASESSLSVTNNQRDDYSGIREIKYRLCTNSEGTESLSGYDWSSQDVYNSLVPNTMYYVQTKVTDQASNTTLSKVKAIKTTDILSTEGKVTVTATNTGASHENWTKKVKVQIEVTDLTALARYTLEVSADGENYSELTTNEMELSENRSIYTRFRDERGYTGNGFLTYVVDNIDNVPPTTTAPTGEMTEEKITVTLKQVDNECGLDDSKTKYRLFADEAGTQIVHDWQTSNVFEGLTANTTYYMQTSAEDYLGNNSESELGEIKTWVVPSIDNLTLTADPSGEWTGGYVRVSANYSKTNFKAQLSLNGTNFVTSDLIVLSSNGTVYARFINGDIPGEETTSITIENIDKTVPTHDKPVITEVTTRKIVATGKQTDTQSGIKTIQYRIIPQGATDEEIEELEWQDSGVFDELLHNTTYYVQTKAEDNVGNVSVSELTEVLTETVPAVNETTAEWRQSPTSWTNGNVTVTVTPQLDDYDIVMKANGGEFAETTQVVVEQNGSVEIRYTDGVNTGSGIVLFITNIDKELPTNTKPTVTTTMTSIEVTCEQTDAQSRIKESTIKYRLVTSQSGEQALEGYDWQTSNKFENLESAHTYYVQTKATDNAGNENVSEVTEALTEAIPDANEHVTYEKTPSEWTNQDVFITFDNDRPEFDLEYSTDRTNYIKMEEQQIKVTQNTTVYVRLTNNISSGKELAIIINNIDKVKPTLALSIKETTPYSIKVKSTATDTTSGIAKVEYRLLKDQAGSQVVKSWQESDTFTGLIEETTYFVQARATDYAGNTSTATAETKTAIARTVIESNKYTILDDEKIITRIPAETTLAQFDELITINKEYQIIDSKGTDITGGLMKTGYILKTENAEYEISVIGDIAPNGKIDISDLPRLRKHLVGATGKTLEGVYFYAADISGDGEVTLLDLLRMRDKMVE